MGRIADYNKKKVITVAFYVLCEKFIDIKK